MPESTRVATIGNSGQQIHLKKNVEVTREVVNQIPQLPTTEPWVILRYNPNTRGGDGSWQNAQTFEDFESADEQFTKLAKDNGASNVERLRAGGIGDRDV